MEFNITDIFKFLEECIKNIDKASASDVFQWFLVAVVAAILYYAGTLAHKIITFEIDMVFERYKKSRTKNDDQNTQ